MLGRIILITERPPQQSVLWHYLHEDQDLVIVSPTAQDLLQQLGAPEVRLVLCECADDGSLAEQMVAGIRNTVRAPLLVWGPADNEWIVIKALRAGADGYLPETYTRAETWAALEAQWRRHWEWGEPVAETKPMEELVLQAESHSVIVGNKQVQLTPTEFRLLEYLAKQEGRIVPREELAYHLWETREAIDAVNFHVCYLRKKLEPDPHRPQFIRTKWGGGYYLAKAERKASA